MKSSPDIYQEVIHKIRDHIACVEKFKRKKKKKREADARMSTTTAAKPGLSICVSTESH